MLETVGLLYDITDEVSPKAWVSVYERMAALVEADGQGAITVFDRQREKMVSMEGRLDRELADDYLSKLQFSSALRLKFAELKVGERLNRQSIISDQELRDHPSYRSIYQRGGIFHLEYRVFLEEGPVQAGIVFTRSEGRKNFSSDDLAAMDHLMPHLARAFQMRFRLLHVQKQNAMINSLFDRVANGVLVLDQTKSVKYTNAAAREMIALKDGLSVNAKNVLAASHAPSETELRQAIDKILESPLEINTELSVPVERPSGRRAYELSLVRLDTNGNSPFDSESLVSVFVSDFSYEPNQDGAKLQHLFDLTPAESRLAMHVAGGRSLNQIADLLGISKSTARTHLKRILSKTSTHSQGELIRLLLTGSVTLRPPQN